MFHYAFGLYLARKNNTVLKLDKSLLFDEMNFSAAGEYRDFGLNMFTVSAAEATNAEINKYNPNPTLPLPEKAFYKIRNKLFPNTTIVQDSHFFNPEHLKLKNEVCIVGRWQSEKYFADANADLRKEFQFKDALDAPNARIASTIKQGHSVAVHVRRSDYVTNKIYFEGLGALDKRYYDAAIAMIKSRVDNLHFFVFSEDIDWCKANIQEANITYVTQDNSSRSAEFDMHLMSLCKHQVISNSTFAWWGAWLSETSDSIIVAPGNWAKTDPFNPPYIIPERWMKVDNKFEGS